MKKPKHIYDKFGQELPIKKVRRNKVEFEVMLTNNNTSTVLVNGKPSSHIVFVGA